MRPQPRGPWAVSIPRPRGAAGPGDGAALGASWSWGLWAAAASRGTSGGEGPGHSFIVGEGCRAVEGRAAPRRGGRGAPELRARPSRGPQGSRGPERSVGTRASLPRRPGPRARHPEGTAPLGTPVRPERRALLRAQRRSPPSVTAPVWDSNQAVMERRWRDPGTGARVNSRCWTRPCADYRDCDPPRSPRSWRVPSVPGDSGCQGMGDLEDVGVTEGAPGRRVGARRGAPGAGAAGASVLMLILP